MKYNDAGKRNQNERSKQTRNIQPVLTFQNAVSQPGPLPACAGGKFTDNGTDQ